MSDNQQSKDWKIFQGDGRAPHQEIKDLPEPPEWRPFGKNEQAGVSRSQQRGETFQARPEAIEMVNAALYLRRPLLITGKAGTGKSSLAYAVARELTLGEVLYWPITTRTTLKDGLYNYDAIGRLQAVKQAETPTPPNNREPNSPVNDPQQIADYITLGPLGTALLPSEVPRVLIIDEIDKSDIDLPNDLLTIFEEGRFEIPELTRLEPEDANPDDQIKVKVRTAYQDRKDPVTGSDRHKDIQGGCITCKEFPLVILTSNGERDFPPPFLRRCLRLYMRQPDRLELEKIINAHLGENTAQQEAAKKIISAFLERRDRKQAELATDQLLNAVFMVTRQRDGVGDEKSALIRRLLKPLDSGSLDEEISEERG